MSGFISSGFSVGGGEGSVGAFKMAIVGGTISALGGGKFANGAMGSAFQYLFNDMMSSMAGAGVKMGTKQGGEKIGAGKSMSNIAGDGAKGLVMGAIGGYKIGGPRMAVVGGIFGFANGLNAGEIFEATGFNSYVDSIIKQTTNVLSNSFHNVPKAQPICNANHQCIMP